MFSGRGGPAHPGPSSPPSREGAQPHGNVERSQRAGAGFRAGPGAQRVVRYRHATWGIRKLRGPLRRGRHQDPVFASPSTNSC